MRRKPSPKQLEQRLRSCRQEYARIKTRIRDVGFICDGSLVERWMTCGKPNCRCSTDPSQRHGPYYQLSWKEQSKTISRRLSPEHAQLYQEWITNRRRLEALLDQMSRVSRTAARHLLDAADSAHEPSLPPQRRRSRKPRRT